MNTVYNPLTGEWERIDDFARPFPVIVRDARVVAVNNTTSFIPTFSTTNSPANTDIRGNTNGDLANIGISTDTAEVEWVVRDPWRIRRFIVVANRTASGVSVNITCVVWGRLITVNNTPTPWRAIVSVTDSGSVAQPVRFVIPASLTGAFGFDQYRITFRREPTSEPAPQLSEIRVLAEF